VERLELDVGLDFRRDEMEIIGAYVSAEEPEAGSRIPVHVILRPFAGPEEVRVVSVAIPRSAADGEVQIEVTGGNAARPPIPEPRSLDDVLRNLGATFPATSVVVTMAQPAQGVSVRGHVVENLPPSALDALRPVAQDTLERPLTTAVQVAAPVGRVVHGRANIRLRVRRPDS